MRDASDIAGLARGVAFRLTENLGVLKREDVAEEIRALDQDSRSQLRKYGVRFGAFNIYLPLLLKPASSDLTLLLWAIHSGAESGIERASIPEPPRQGLTSPAADPAMPETAYRMAGFHLCGRRVVRIDMLERLADMIRPLVAWREKSEGSAKPEGSTGNGGFRVQPDMMSIVGCSGEDFAVVLQALGFRRERKPLPPAAEAAPTGDTAPIAESATDHTPDASTGTAPPDPAADAAPAAGDTPAQPQFDEIWRPRRKNARPERAPRRDGAKRDGPKRDGRERRPGAKRRPPRKDTKKPGGKPAARPRKEKAPDPDSPFAALKDLKREMESGVKG